MPTETNRVKNGLSVDSALSLAWASWSLGRPPEQAEGDLETTNIYTKWMTSPAGC